MPAVSRSHPSPKDLIAFGLGKLTGGAEEAIARHLEGCDVCSQSVANVPVDSFVALVRDSGQRGTSRVAPAAPQRQDALTAPPAPAESLPPELVGHARYRLLRELGRGGMGVVYLAEHLIMKRPVAIKVINKAMLDQPEIVARFLEEARAAGRLGHHDNIVQAHDAEQAGDLCMLVMEYVDGHTLAKVLEKKGPLPVAHACHYIREAALGLQHAFEHGMVHRDIKPQNLMLTRKGRLKVLDFGLARLVRKRNLGLTQQWAFMGTPEYVAPEQANDARAADIRADIYSLGCTLYCLLAGRPPFLEETAVGQVLAHLEQEAQPLVELRTDVPLEVSALVTRMLAKDPTQRWQTPREVAEALLPLIQKTRRAVHDPVPGVRQGMGLPDRGTKVAGDTSQVLKPALAPGQQGPSLPRRTEGSPRPSQSQARTRPTPHPAGSTRKWLVIGIGAALLGTLLGVSVHGLFWGGDDRPPRTISRSEEGKGEPPPKPVEAKAEAPNSQERPLPAVGIPLLSTRMEKGAGPELSPRFDSFKKSLKNPECGDVLWDWKLAIDSATGETVEGNAAAFAIVIKWDPWFVGNEYDQQSARRNVDRCRQMSQELIKSWRQAVKDASDTAPGKIDMVLWLSQQDRLFKDEKYSKSENDLLLARSRSIPRRAIQQWDDASKVGPEGSALRLFLIDSLFEETGFREPEFAKLLLAAREKGEW